MTATDEQVDRDDAGDSPARSAGRRLPRVSRRPVALLLAVAFFFGPGMAYVAGARPEAIENRSLSEFPGVSAGWDFFEETSAWAIDHLPLRGEAVRANASLSERVFDEPPSYGGGTNGPVGVPQPNPSEQAQGAPGTDYPPVIQGSDGWLYYGGDAEAKCQPAMSVDEVMSRLHRLAAAVTDSGRTFVLAIPPDKTTVWPRNLPDTYMGEQCMTERTEEFWTALYAAPPTGYVDLRRPIEQEQVRTGKGAYRETDTHWGQFGAAYYGRSLALAADPDTFRRVVLTVQPKGTISKVGDLGRLIGQPHEDTFPKYGIDVVQPGNTYPPRAVELDGKPSSVYYATRDAPPTVAATTLLMGDSFNGGAVPFVEPLFADLTQMNNEAAGADPGGTAATMVESDVVIYEIVERSVSSGRARLLDETSVRTIERILADNPR